MEFHCDHCKIDTLHSEVLCNWSNCTEYTCLRCNRINLAIGPAACGCDWLTGWRSVLHGGKSKPGMPYKPRGRHKGRMLRKNRLMRNYRKDAAIFWEMLENIDRSNLEEWVDPATVPVL